LKLFSENEAIYKALEKSVDAIHNEREAKKKADEEAKKKAAEEEEKKKKEAPKDAPKEAPKTDAA